MDKATEKDSEYERNYQRFVDNLKKARKETGYTQIEVSKLLNKSQSYVSKIERGELRLDIVQLLDFVRLYNKPIQYFIRGIE